MVIGSDIETVVGHKRGESGSGSWGVGGTMRLWRTVLFYGVSRSREFQVGGGFSAQRFNISASTFTASASVEYSTRGDSR